MFWRPTAWPMRIVGIIMLIGAATAAVLEPFPVREVRLAVFDFMQRTMPRPTVAPSASPVVIVGIDEKSLAVLGQWPWPRARLADLADRLLALDARVVAFDIVFAEADRWGGDGAFATAIAGRPVVLGMAPKAGEAPTDPIPYPGSTIAVDDAGIMRQLPRGGALVRNLPELERKAAGLGAIVLSNDGDRVVRRVPTVTNTPTAVVPSLFVETLRVAQGANGIHLDGGADGARTLRLEGGAALATDAYGNVWPYFGRLEGREILSAADVLDGTIGRERVAGRYVLVGATATSLGDSHLSPLGQIIPGVETHAQALEGALGGHLLARSSYLPGAELACLILSALLAITLFPVCRAGALLPALAVGVVALAGLSWGLFVGQHLLFDVSLSIATVLVLFSVIVALRLSGTSGR